MTMALRKLYFAPTVWMSYVSTEGLKTQSSKMQNEQVFTHTFF